MRKEEKKYYIGKEAEKKRENLNMEYPINQGIITNFDYMEKIWDYCFYEEMKIDPKDHTLLISDSPLNPKSKREKMAEIMFEKYGFPSLFLENSSILAIYASGRTTGIVADIGETVSYIVPIYEGFNIPIHTKKMDIGGRDLTEYLMRLLNERGHSFVSISDRKIASDIKEKLCYIAYDFEEEMKNANEKKSIEKKYESMNGDFFTIGNERLKCPEMLFNPSLNGIEEKGIHEIIYESISKCDVDIRRFLYGNIILSGGSSQFPGFADRLRKEIQYLAPLTMSLKVTAPPERSISTWIGGSIITTLSNFGNMFILKEEYEEFGIRIIGRKFF
ncbi:actin-7-related [Anaeramoeba ignava]|uniref:Actin-7-related n=1 Tax=Anaeramoeba ignava TaxID=1746090 RepID=A0A9Q0LCP4_ANAIG|nr:actin-7-related [Anaeramoeba ignava]